VRILDRLVLTETAGATALATGGCVFILTAGNLVRQVAGEMAAGRIDGFQALELLVLILPSVLPHALPLGVLAGILIAFGRMGAQSEVTAMRAGGVPLWRIASPVLYPLTFSTSLIASQVKPQLKQIPPFELFKVKLGRPWSLWAGQAAR
jgi:lipopolysaccharide export system permease protein